MHQYTDRGQFATPFWSTCHGCLQWSLPIVLGPDPAYRYIRCLDGGFPVDAESGRLLNTHAGPINMTLLRQAWDEAFLKWVDLGVWTAQQVESYFKVLTINDSTTA